MRKVTGDRKYIYVCVVLFVISAVFYGIMSDFPKVISGYPDELRYVGIGRSLAGGRGIRLHGMESNFQKILYSICIMPAFWMKSTAEQIRAVGYINSLIMASAVFPIYGLCRRILKEDRAINYTLALGITFPAFVYTTYFMSEVIYLPLSLWVIYIVWCIFCTENFRIRLELNLLLGVMCYLTYLNKEIALYFVIAYVLVWLMYCVTHSTTEKVGEGLICLVVFAGIFVCFFLLMKGTLFSGMPNSYSSSNLQVLHLKWSWEKIRYLLYGLICDVVFGVLAFGIFPFLVPAAFFQKREKESWFYLFLLCSFFIGCITIAYMITLPEDFGSRAPRLHMRYLEPLVIPFYILMVDRIRKADYAEREETGVFKYRQRILGIGIAVFVMLLIRGSGGGSFLADNSTLLYYELFARFISKSEITLLLLRLLVVIAAIAGFIVVCKRKLVFLKLFGILFITLNVVNSAAGICAGHYRYGIQEEKRQQAVYANEYLKGLQGNILLLSEGKETSPEDKRLFDTYIDVEFFVCDMDGSEMSALLKDNVIDLFYERLRCDVSGDYYPDLSRVDYIIVKNDYDVRLMEDSAEKLEDFPLEGYSIYKNLDAGKIYIAGEI